MKKKLVIGVLIFGAIIAGFVLANSRQSILAVKTITLEQGSIEFSVKATGKIRSRQEIAVSPLSASRIVAISVEEGQEVAKGALLATLDDRQAQVRKDMAQASLTRATYEAKNASNDLDAVRVVWQAGGESRSAVNDAQQKLEVAKEHLARARSDLRTAQLELGNFRIHAPFAGIIAVKQASVGQTAELGASLFILTDPNQREILIRLDPSDAANIAPGQLVEVSSDAFPGKLWREKVLRLDPTIRKEGAANDIGIWISLGPDAPLLRLGQQVDVQVRTAYRPNATRLPYEALTSKDGKHAVAVIHNGVMRLQPIQTGIEDTRYIEVVSGVSPGEQVILSAADIHENQRVEQMKAVAQ